MFALEVEYLTGRATATSRHDRDEPEWPPHPGRLFSALVAACHEADWSATEREAGRQALLWLEQQPPPSLCYSMAQPRDVVPVYVPVNDSVAPEPRGGKGFSAGQIADGVKVLPERRSRQARTFPSVTPDEPRVWFVWPHADPQGHRIALERLAESLTYLGHSSSLAKASFCDSLQAQATLEPSEAGSVMLRVPAAGRLEELEAAYERGHRPSPGTYQAYRTVVQPIQEPSIQTVFGDCVVRRLTGPFLPLSVTAHAMGKVRDSLLNKATETAAPATVLRLLSGHTDEGGVSKEDHVAVFPLAFVNHRYADGGIKGFAVVLPRGLERFSEERRHILRALSRLQEVRMGNDRRWSVETPLPDEVPKSLLLGPYLGPSRTWATVTPVLCDKFPKDKPGQTIEDVLRAACRRVMGLEPQNMAFSPVAWFRGSPASHGFERRRKAGDVPRHRVHVWLEFAKTVSGPLLLGAGRFHGLGLFRCWRESEGQA